MSNKYMVIVVQYLEEDERAVKTLIESIKKPIEARHGEARLVYQGFEKRVIKALESILDLAK